MFARASPKSLEAARHFAHFSQFLIFQYFNDFNPTYLWYFTVIREFPSNRIKTHSTRDFSSFRTSEKNESFFISLPNLLKRFKFSDTSQGDLLYPCHCNFTSCRESVKIRWRDRKNGESSLIFPIVENGCKIGLERLKNVAHILNSHLIMVSAKPRLVGLRNKP